VGQIGIHIAHIQALQAAAECQYRALQLNRALRSARPRVAWLNRASAGQGHQLAIDARWDICVDSSGISHLDIK